MLVSSYRGVGRSKGWVNIPRGYPVGIIVFYVLAGYVSPVFTPGRHLIIILHVSLMRATSAGPYDVSYL